MSRGRGHAPPLTEQWPEGVLGRPWDSCVTPLGPFLRLLQAAGVKQIMAGLKRIPVLGNQVDELLTASAQQLIGQAQLA